MLCFVGLAAAPLSAQYFPAGVLGSTLSEDEFRTNWYSRNIKALHEPSLWEVSRQNPKAEVYRFLYVRTFDHPISIRLVVRKSGSGWINTHITGGAAGYDPGRIVQYRISWLTKGKTQSFVTALNSADFWNMPTHIDPPKDVIQLDGAQWILEGVKNGQYHIVDRWSPEAADPVRAIGLLALKLGRVRHLRSSEIY